MPRSWARWDGVYINVEALIANDFHLRGGDAAKLARGPARRSMCRSRSAGRSFPLHGEAHYRRSHRRLAHARGGRRACRPASTGSTSAPSFSYTQDYLRGRRSRRRAELGMGAARQRPHRRGSHARLGRFRRRSPAATVQERRAVGLLVGDRDTATGRPGSPMTGSSIAPALGCHAHPSRRYASRSRLPAKRRATATVAVGFNLNFSLDPRHGFTLVAPAARPRRDGPRDRLSRSQRQWRARSRRAARERRAGHDRHPPGGAQDRRQRARSPSAA